MANYYNTLQQEINRLEQFDLKRDENFFSKTVLNQLIVIHDLMIFPHIEHEKFQQYIGWFRNDIRLDINHCVALPANAGREEQLALLERIKKHAAAKLKVMRYAFTIFLHDREMLQATAPVKKPAAAVKNVSPVPVPFKVSFG